MLYDIEERDTDSLHSDQQQKREMIEMIARQVQMDPTSAAISLGSLANIAKIGGDVVSGFESLFGSVTLTCLPRCIR